MKKALSILLSVMMVAGLFVALVPTASAADMYVVDMPELGEELYFNDFDRVDASLEGDALLEELGWYLSSNVDADADGYGDTRYTYEENLRDAEGNALADVLVSESYADGSQAIILQSNATVAGGNGGSWETLNFIGNNKLIGGDYVIEFDYMALSSHVEADNAPETFASSASGASSGPIATAKYNTATKSTVYWHYGIKSRGQTDIHCSYPGGTNGGKGYGGADYATAELGSETMYGMTTAQNKAIKFRIVVSSTTGICAYTSNDGGDTWTQGDSMTEAHATAFAAQAQNIGAEIKWRCTSTFDTMIDNLGIYLIKDKVAPAPYNPHIVTTTAPELVITEIATQATATDNQKLHTLAQPGLGADDAQAGTLTASVDANGNYILPADESESLGTQTTRFEYIEIYNAGNATVDLSDYSISSWGTKVMAETTLSAVSRIHKGLTVVTDSADGLQWQYYNAPEDCILAPGEAAILFMPNNWFFGTPTFGTVAAFKQYVLIDEYGYTPEEVAEMKVLTLYDSLDELYEIFGQYDSNDDGEPDKNYYTLVNGLGINNSGNTVMAVVKDNADGSIPYTFREEDHKCYPADLGDKLISYVADSQGGDNSVWRWGNLSGGISHAGYKMAGGHAAQYTYWDAEGNFLPGGKLDTTRLPSAKLAENRTVGYVPADMQKPEGGAPAGAEYALWTGYQTAGEDVRFVAEIADITDVKYIAFEITVPDAEVTKTVYLEYVYEKLSTNFGEDDLGFKYEGSNYFVALEITGVGMTTDFEVSVITVYDDDTQEVDTVGKITVEF